MSTPFARRSAITLARAARCANGSGAAAGRARGFDRLRGDLGQLEQLERLAQLGEVDARAAPRARAPSARPES